MNQFPDAYEYGFAIQDYDAVERSLAKDPRQALVSFGELQTTLLHAAAYDGQVHLVKLLLTLGADIDAREVNGRTPLHHAANNGHQEVIEYLVRQGADVNAIDMTEMTPLMWIKISRSCWGEKKAQLLEFLRGAGATEI